MKHPQFKRPAAQRGLTLIELLVALVISSVIIIAAISALIVSRQGFSTVDAASQLRDNARFATQQIQRFAVQAGFNDFEDATTTWTKDKTTGIPVSSSGGDTLPSVFGFNNATASASDPTNVGVARVGTTSLGYGSDVLILKYQVPETYPSSTKADKSMIDCFGAPPVDSDIRQYPGDRRTNVLHIAVSTITGEPELNCSTDKKVQRQPILAGVENFQVLYGVDGVTANVATATTVTPTFIATNYLRADQMAVVPDPTGDATNANWRRVRSIKIGMVIRGPLGSAQQALSQTYYPFGKATSAAGGSTGSAMSSVNDPGTAYTPPADTRLRQVVTFTVHLRNEQGL